MSVFVLQNMIEASVIPLLSYRILFQDYLLQTNNRFTITTLKRMIRYSLAIMLEIMWNQSLMITNRLYKSWRLRNKNKAHYLQHQKYLQETKLIFQIWIAYQKMNAQKFFTNRSPFKSWSSRGPQTSFN